MNELLQLPSNLSIQGRVNCIQSSAFIKAFDFFRFVPLPKKQYGVKVIVANISINLVTKKNLLLRELESEGDLLKKVEPLVPFESVRSL